ncbi:MAG: transcriptional regulator [Verrucomicrobia bacterium]|nr:transcriptional regulator [Verrucomicrobiota bacterium]
MSAPRAVDIDALERVFHEPNRLAIMSAVCAAPDGIRFRELREACSLTDGNLNRHLKMLEDSRVIRVDKRFVDGKPCTTIHLSRTGLQRFQEYLDALALVLKTAQRALPEERHERATAPFGRTAMS